MLYDFLFESAWETLQTFGENRGLKMGMIAVLHTWGQNLSLHPHLHCIVPGGGVDESGAWKNIRSDGKFLFSVKALSKVFRAKFCEKLKHQLSLKLKPIVLKKLPKRACPELAEGFNRSFIVGSSSPTKLWLLSVVFSIFQLLIFFHSKAMKNQKPKVKLFQKLKHNL